MNDGGIGTRMEGEFTGAGSLICDNPHKIFYLLRGHKMSEKKILDQNVVDELEKSKNEVLQRIAAKLKNQINSNSVCAGHNSHSSGMSGRTHSSSTTH